MHRLILGVKPDVVVDHVNGDGLDNRRLNLRPATKRLNSANRRADRRKVAKTSSFKGVYWDKSRDKWMATIHAAGRTRSLGRFDDEEVAARAYDAAATEAWGEYARLNFPQPPRSEAM